MTMCPCPGPPLVESSCFTRCRRQAPTGRHANPTLAGGSDDEAASTIRCGQERLLCGGQTRMSNDRHSSPDRAKRLSSSRPATDTCMGGDVGQHRYGKDVGPLFRCAVSAPGGVALDCAGSSRRPAWALPGGCGISANNCAASMRTCTAPTGRCGRSSIRESCLTLPSTAHGACLGCQWFDVRGHFMSHSDWFERASVWPHRHQVSNGVFLDGPRRWRGGRFDPP